MSRDSYLRANWDAPTSVMALTTTRHAPGVSAAPFDRCNLGANTEDSLDNVLENRHLLQQDLGLEHPPIWLTQVHGDVIYQATGTTTESPVADACFTREKNIVCTALTADCIPVLLTDMDASFVAALHCGWKGLHNDLIEKTLDLVPNRDRVIAWIGPGISQQHYQVDDAFQRNFCDKHTDFEVFFQKVNNSYHTDLPGIAEYQLQQAGVKKIFQSGICTFADQRFYSYRRDSKQAGRIVSLIGLQN